jgi:hypothetical protein
MLIKTKRQEDFNIEKVRKLCHNIQAIDRYMAKIQSQLMPDNKREMLVELRDELKKLTDERKEMFSADEQHVYGRAKKLIGL